MPLIQSAVGPSVNTSGAQPNLRGANDGSLVVLEAGSRLQEPCYRGLTFGASVPAAGAAPGTAIGTTAAFAVANPAASGKLLVLHHVSVGYVSGTLGAGVLQLLVHGTPNITAPSGGTAVTPTCLRTDLAPATTSVANVRAGATVPASGVPVRNICSLGAALASTVLGIYGVADTVDGIITVGPGTAISFQGTAAGGSTPLITIACAWAEIPI